MDSSLSEKLLELKNSDYYPFHMPGHKRNNELITSEGDFGSKLLGAYDIDITEIDGFDNLHDPKDVIKDSEKRAASLYKSDETHFLVNGSTGGILSAIAAVTNRGKKIIVARNCHISVYNAIYLNELEPVFLYPDLMNISDTETDICTGIRRAQVEKAILSNMDACAVVITSPTYDGVLSDISSIAEIAHEYDIPLIVDEAHGALFFMEGRSAIDCGADIVINSVHKTLPALTQTALIHVNGKIVDRNLLRKYLRIYQTSSPSYVLMGSIDYAMEIMSKNGNSLYRDFCIRTVRLKEELLKLRNIKYISKDSLIKQGAFDFDESKVLISSGRSGLSGKQIYDILRLDYKLQPEMAAGNYVLLMTTLFDTDEGIERLSNALFEIDKRCENKEYAFDVDDESIDPEDEVHIAKLKECLNRQSEKTVFAYPPGIPIVVAGEIVTDDVVKEITKAAENRLDLKWLD